jgi:putative aldouronate transport system permease protein
MATMMKTRRKGHGAKILFNIGGSTYLVALGLLCVLPFLQVLIGSFTLNPDIIKYGYSLFPKDWSLDAYRAIFLFPEKILHAYEVSIFVTVVGTIAGVFLMSMGGYVLQRKELKYKNGIAFFIYFTTLFNCGLIPWYLLIINLGMKDSLSALIIPSMESAFSILLIRNFMRSVPDSLIESAKIDGAGDFFIYIKIVMPLSKAVLATVGLFLALQYWNDWYSASLFIKESSLWPLQFLLYKTISAQFVALSSAAASFFRKSGTTPTESVKLATAVVTTGPIILLYPFLQKYFVQGITIGAVKG